MRKPQMVSKNDVKNAINDVFGEVIFPTSFCTDKNLKHIRKSLIWAKKEVLKSLKDMA